MAKKSVLLINEGFSDNLGDQVIKESIVFLIEDNNNYNITFADFTKNIKEPATIFLKKEYNGGNKFFLYLKKIIPVKFRWMVKNLKRIVSASKKKHDIVIIGGGQLILSNSTFAIAMFCWILCLQIFSHKNIYLVGVGSGVSFSFFDKLLYTYSLKRFKDIYIRDERSQQILLDQYSIKTKFIYDLAFIHPLFYYKQQTIESESKSKEILKNLLGIVSYDVYIRYNKKRKLSRYAYYETWLDILRMNSILLQQCTLFYTTQADRDECLKFSEYIRNKYNLSLKMIETNTKEKLVNTICSANIIVSARMHALILSVAYKKKTVTYGISDKLKEFERMIYRTRDISLIQNQIQNQISVILK